MKVGFFNISIIVLIVLFLTFSILYETTNNVKTFIILLSAIGFSSLIFIALRYREIYFPLPTSLFIFLFLFWMLISAFFSKDISSTIWEILRTASFFGLFFAVYNLVRKNKHAQFFLLVTFAIVGTLLVAKDMYHFFSWGRLETGRYLVGSFSWHNQMAGFLAILISLTCGLFLATRNLYFKIFLFLSILLLFIGIALTQSRGGWLSLFAALLLFVFIYLRRMKLVIKPIFILVGLFLVTIMVLQAIGVVEKAKSVSGNLRVTVWQGALEMIKDYPVFGVGPGAFGSSYHQYQQQPWLYARNGHNHYLEYAAEIGIIGFFLFALIILSVVFAVFKAREPLLVGTVSALFGSVAHAFIDTDWNRVSLYSIFWILMAVVLAGFVKKEKKIDIVGARKVVYLFLFLPLVFALILGISNRSYEMAKKSLEEDKIEEAESSILTAIKFNPFDFPSQALYGQLKEIQKKPDFAKDIYQKAASLSFFNSEPVYRIGLIEFEKANYKQALKWFEKAVRLNPYSHPKLYEAVADTYLELKDKEQVRRYLKLAIEKAFPLNESFRGFEYLYDYTGFKKDLAKTYIRLAFLDITLGEQDEAKRLLAIIEKELDSENPLIPVLKDSVVK